MTPPNASRAAAYHFIGVGGIGMSGIAQVCAARGMRVSGSDRSYDRGQREALFGTLAQQRVELFPQDGSAMEHPLDAAVVSTAIEDTNSDIAAAKSKAVPIVHRSEVLAQLLNGTRSIAVTGTSGKTTTTAMLGWMLEVAGFEPTVINGGVMNNFAALHPPGNAVARPGEWVCAEADESDGSVVRFRPEVGVVTTVARDHKEIDELLALFEQFASQTRGAVVLNADYPELAGLRRCAGRAVSYGSRAGADVRVTRVEPSGFGSTFDALGRRFRILMPGRHNVSNAAAALAAGQEIGLPADSMEEALATFVGVHRRLELVARAGGVQVVDDYAHNPEKIAAAIATLQPQSKKLVAVFQPHGFGPAKFMRDELAATLAKQLRPSDVVYMLDIYYAGGTADQSISSADLVDDLARVGVRAQHAPDRAAVVREIAQLAEPGTTVLVMGARDDTLTDFCHTLAETVSTRETHVGHG